jgi:hypothetical protein
VTDAQQVLAKASAYEVTITEEYVESGEIKKYDDNGSTQTKNREWIVLKGGENVDEAYEKLSGIYGGGVITTQFTDGVFTLVWKLKVPALAVPEGYAALAPMPKGTLLTVAKVPDLIKQFKVGTVCKGDIDITEVAKKKLPPVDEVIEEVMHLSPQAFLDYLGNAKINQKDKRATPLEQSLIACHTEVEKRMKMIEMGNQMLKDVHSQSYEYPVDFEEFVPKTRGDYWDIHSCTIGHVTLHEFFFKSDMHLEYIAVIIGRTGRGKSELIKALASRISDRDDYAKFAFIKKSLDQCGAMTRTGSILQAGAFACTDLDLVTLKDDVPFDIDEKKAICKVNEPASFRARYWAATLPECVPRIFAVNLGPNGEYDNWFIRNDLSACAALCNGDVQGCKNATDEQEACMRQVVIFKVDDMMYKPKINSPGKKSVAASKFANRKPGFD